MVKDAKNAFLHINMLLVFFPVVVVAVVFLFIFHIVRWDSVRKTKPKTKMPTEAQISSKRSAILLFTMVAIDYATVCCHFQFSVKFILFHKQRQIRQTRAA